MASITIIDSSITVTDNNLIVNYTTDVALDKVELTNDDTNYIVASTYSQTSATFDISSWSDGTYSSCKLRITYEVVSNYGEIVLNTTTIEVNEAGTGIFTVNLDSAPTNNQVVNLAVNNNNCTLDKTSLTFTSSNYSAAQTVTITGAHDSSNYADMSSTITATSDNVSNKTLGVTIKNIDTQTSTGQALDDWDVYNNTYSYNYVAYMATQVGVSDKAIRITAEEKTVTVTPTGGTGSTTTKDYVSGGLVTKKAFKYGTFTFKCKLSANDTYLWAMIWTLPDDTTMARPEFDLWESWGSKTSNNIVQTYHCYTEDGTAKDNYQQAMTAVDLTQEHTVKAVWTEDNVFKMYVDGVLKLTISDYMVNWETGEVDYQVWFLNLGLGTYAGDAPNGTGWMEITDYTFEPVYTRDRVKQHTWCGNWTDGTAPSGDLPSSSGSSGDIENSLTITNITVLSSTVASTQINYTTNKPVTTHYFNMWYSGSDSGFTDGTTRVTDNGNNNYTMVFENALSVGTKSPAIKVEDADGNIAIAEYTLVIT